MDKKRLTAVLFIGAVSTISPPVALQGHAQAFTVVTAKLGLRARPIQVSCIQTTHNAIKVKGKGTCTWYSASSWIITSEALRYGTCSQGISQFYLHTHVFNPQSEWAIPAFAQLVLIYTDPGGMEGWVGLGGWLRSETIDLQSPIPLLTGLNVEQLRWSRPTRYRHTKPPQ